jgi:hypothetical protein
MLSFSNKIFATALFSQLKFYGWGKNGMQEHQCLVNFISVSSGKPSLIHGQASPCTVLFITVPAGADVCVCSPVRPQIFSCSHSNPPTEYSWFFAMMVKSIKRPQIHHFRSLKI